MNEFTNIVSSVVLYWWETCSPTLREVHRLKVFQYRVLRRVLEPKRQEVTGERRRLHKEELHDLQFSHN
jgi:hypothetical protein